MSLKRSLRRFEKTPCQQGATLRDPVNLQPMHSVIGPELEAELIFLGPSRARQRLTEVDPRTLVVWDVGMGIAGNSAPLWKTALGGASKRPLQIHSFEQHPEALTQALESTQDFAYLQSLESSLKELTEVHETQFQDSGGLHHRWVLHAGDFQDFLASPPARDVAAPDIIFWDFYTPKICSELWSLEVFESLNRVSPQAELYTYSAATPVRLALLLAGFWVGRSSAAAPATPIKSESTIAVANPDHLTAIPELLGQEWLEKLSRSTQFRPYGQSRWSTQASYDEIAAKVRKLPQFRLTADR